MEPNNPQGPQQPNPNLQMPHNTEKVPAGVTKTGEVAMEELSTAYMRAVIAIPEMLASLIERLDGVENELGSMALVMKRYGENENILKPDDFTDDDDDDDGAVPQ